METTDLSDVGLNMLQELNRQGEQSLAGTIQFALSNDQRAITLTGVFGTVASALAALVGALMTASHEPATPILVSIGAGASILFTSAIFCALSARPTDFFVLGYEPRLLVKACSNDDLAWLLRASIVDIQARIHANRNALDRSAKILKWGMWLGVSALPISVMVFIVFFEALRLS